MFPLVSCHLEQADLRECIKKTFGESYVIANVVKLHGGAQKVVYRIDCDNGFSCLLYVWDISLNYFQEEIENEDIHRQSYGSQLFENNNKYLTEQGIRTPALYTINKERLRYPFDYALVEYIRGDPAETYFHHVDSHVRQSLFERIGDMLRRMHTNERRFYGKVYSRDINESPCHLPQLVNAEKQLAYASQYIDGLRNNQGKLLDALDKLESAIKPRTTYRYIHGELGPDHILVNEKLEPYLIDIEGAQFFDIEHEHSFLEFRFGQFYSYMKNDCLDHSRILFYKLHHHLSLASGGLKLLHRGFPNQTFAKGLAEYHSKCALQFLQK